MKLRAMFKLLILCVIAFEATLEAAVTKSDSPCSNPIEMISGEAEVLSAVDNSLKRSRAMVALRFCGTQSQPKLEIPLETTKRQVDGRFVYSSISARIYPNQSGALLITTQRDLKPQDAEAVLRGGFTEFKRFDSEGNLTCKVKLIGMSPDAVSQDRRIAFAAQLRIDEPYWKSRHSTPYDPELGRGKLIAIDGACKTIFSQDFPDGTPSHYPVIQLSPNGLWGTISHRKLGTAYLTKVDISNGTTKTFRNNPSVSEIDDSGRLFSQKASMTIKWQAGKMEKSESSSSVYYREVGDEILPIDVE